MITLLGCPAMRPSTMCECGHKKKNNKHGEGRRKARSTQQTKPQTQPKHKHTASEKKCPRNKQGGKQKTSQYSINYVEMTAYARKRQTKNTQKRAAKHKATGRNQENSGQKREGVRVSAYLLPDLCSLDKGGRRDRR